MAFFDVFGLTERYFRRRLLNKLLVSKKPHRRPSRCRLTASDGIMSDASAIRACDEGGLDRTGFPVRSGRHVVYQDPYHLLQHLDEVGVRVDAGS